MGLNKVMVIHQGKLGHHVVQGIEWLDASNGGRFTAALSYAALELRFAIERLAVQYWTTLLDRRLEAQDMSTVESFRRMEARIYELAGHQQTIDSHFSFMQLLFNALQINHPLRTPRISLLKSYWHTCSEMCHIGWPLVVSGYEEEEGPRAYAVLSTIAEELKLLCESCGWPMLREAGVIDLRNRFISGEASEDDVLQYMRVIGLWAATDHGDGRAPEFLGEPIEPNGPGVT